MRLLAPAAVLAGTLAAVSFPAGVAAHGAAPTQQEVRPLASWFSRLLPLFDPIAVARAAARISIDESAGFRLIQGDGLPDHLTGAFPNRGNPNAIRPQSQEYRVPLRPQIASRPTPLIASPFGIALNGVLFDPGTAEFWNNNRSSGWNYEALSGKIDLGLDASNAHVQPNGAYHYHGIPAALVARGGRDRPAWLGYAADGFPIYGPDAYLEAGSAVSPLVELRPGYRLKSATRPSGPGGAYDGTFVEDYEFVPGHGDLDACNGRLGVTPEYPGGTYYYVLSTRFPFIPRCYMGTPDASFMRRPPPGGRPGKGLPGKGFPGKAAPG